MLPDLFYYEIFLHKQIFFCRKIHSVSLVFETVKRKNGIQNDWLNFLQMSTIFQLNCFVYFLIWIYLNYNKFIDYISLFYCVVGS